MLIVCGCLRAGGGFWLISTSFVYMVCGWFARLVWFMTVYVLWCIIRILGDRYVVVGLDGFCGLTLVGVEIVTWFLFGRLAWSLVVVVCFLVFCGWVWYTILVVGGCCISC